MSSRATVPAGQVRPADPAPAAWQLLAPPGTVQVGARLGRRTLSRLPAGTPVALVDTRLLGRWRLRRLAAGGGVVVERELLVLPGRDHPVLVVDAADSAVRLARGRLANPLLRRLPPGWLAAVAPAVHLGYRR